MGLGADTFLDSFLAQLRRVDPLPVIAATRDDDEDDDDPDTIADLFGAG